MEYIILFLVALFLLKCFVKYGFFKIMKLFSLIALVMGSIVGISMITG